MYICMYTFRFTYVYFIYFNTYVDENVGVLNLMISIFVCFFADEINDANKLLNLKNK